MKVRSKRYRSDAKKVEGASRRSVDEAVKILKTLGTTKFDQTVNLVLKLNIDPKKADQLIRGSVSLPHGIGKPRKVLVFADGDEAAAAQEAGAEYVGTEDLAKKIQDGWDDFDVAIAVQRAMKVASRLGKVLGPKGKMPNPKNGTVVGDGKLQEMKTVVREFRAGRVEFRNDAAGNLHVPVGKISFSDVQLRENIEAFVEHIKGMRPTTVKGFFVTGAHVGGAMTPALALNIAPI